MQIHFCKYQGAGNDFVMLDNLDGKYDSLSITEIAKLCDRRFGIGADGLIKISSANNFDFVVDYYNSDGSKSFCGNGARCSVAFAKTLGIDVIKTSFLAIDGEHEASLELEEVRLKMADVKHISKVQEEFILDTGSPHFIKFISENEKFDVYQDGKSIRYSETYKKEGINVNFVENLKSPNHIFVSTYERGVENETLSCGTGVTASSIAFALKNNLEGFQKIDVKTKGGNLKVEFDIFENSGEFEAQNVFLIGPAVFVFEGEITL